MTEHIIYSSIDLIPRNWELPIRGITYPELSEAAAIIAEADPKYRITHYLRLGRIASSLGKFDFVNEVAMIMEQDKDAITPYGSRWNEVESLYSSAAEYAVVLGQEQIGENYLARIQSPIKRESTYSRMAQAAAERGRLTYSYKLALQGPRGSLLEADTFHPLVTEISKRGKYELAQRVARKVVSDDTYESLITNIVREALNNEHVDEARRLAESITSEDYLSHAYTLIAEATNNIELLNKAEKLALQVSDGNIRQELLFEIYRVRKKLPDNI